MGATEAHSVLFMTRSGTEASSGTDSLSATPPAPRPLFDDMTRDTLVRWRKSWAKPEFISLNNQVPSGIESSDIPLKIE